MWHPLLIAFVACRTADHSDVVDSSPQESGTPSPWQPEMTLTEVRSWASTTGRTHHATVAFLSDASIAVAWNAFPYGPASESFMQRLDTYGTPLAGTLTPIAPHGHEAKPEILVDAEDRILVATEDMMAPRVTIRRFDADGTRVHVDVGASVEQTRGNNSVDLATLHDGTVVATWYAEDAPGAQGTFWVRTLDASLSPLQDALLVASVANHPPIVGVPDLARLPDGFALARVDTRWGASNRSTLTITPFRGAAPPTRGAEVLLDHEPAGLAFRPSIAADSNGRMAMAWYEGYLDGVFTGSWVAFLDPTGMPFIPPFTPMEGPATLPVVDFLDDDHVVLAWHVPPDGDGVLTSGVYVAVRSFPDAVEVYPPTLFSSSHADATRPNLAVRPDGDGVWRVAVSWEQSTADASVTAVVGRVATFRLR